MGTGSALLKSHAVGFSMAERIHKHSADWLVVWNPLFLDPSDGVSCPIGLAGLLQLPHLCLFCLSGQIQTYTLCLLS